MVNKGPYKADHHDQWKIILIYFSSPNNPREIPKDLAKEILEIAKKICIKIQRGDRIHKEM